MLLLVINYFQLILFSLSLYIFLYLVLIIIIIIFMTSKSIWCYLTVKSLNPSSN